VITDACDPSRCNRDCEVACPYDIPRNDGGKEKKCDFCYDRIADGKAPSYAETCRLGLSRLAVRAMYRGWLTPGCLSY